MRNRALASDKTCTQTLSTVVGRPIGTMISIASIVLGLGIFASAANAAGIEVKFGTVNQPGGMQYESAAEFARRFNEKVGNQAEMTVYHSSQLGNDKEMMQKVKLGTLEISQPSSIMSTIQAEFGLFDMPYLVKDRGHAKCIAEHIVMPKLATMLEAKGYKLLGVWENGFRNISNNVRPINTPDDLRDIKLRTPKGVWRVRMFQGYGANPTPMAFSEVFTALQTGVIDGQENPYVNIYSARFQEVQKYLSETRHVYTPSFPTASLRLFNKFPKEIQDALLTTATDVVPWTYETAANKDGEIRDKLIAGGMRFNEADRESFVSASKPVYEQFAKEVDGGGELIEQALALADGC